MSGLASRREEERGHVIESFEERVRVRGGRLALTDGGEFFGEELPGEDAGGYWRAEWQGDAP